LTGDHFFASLYLTRLAKESFFVEVMKVVTFLSDSWVELKKVVWPSRNQTVKLTLAVLAVTFGVAGFTAALDYFFSRVLNLLVGK